MAPAASGSRGDGGGDGNVDDADEDAAVAAVYVPHIPGYNRVFAQVSAQPPPSNLPLLHAAALSVLPATIVSPQHAWPVADFISIMPRRLMKPMLEDVERYGNC